MYFIFIWFSTAVFICFGCHNIEAHPRAQSKCLTKVSCYRFQILKPTCGAAELSKADIQHLKYNVSLEAKDCQGQPLEEASILWHEFFPESNLATVCRDKFECVISLETLKNSKVDTWIPGIWLNLNAIHKLVRLPVTFVRIKETSKRLDQDDGDSSVIVSGKILAKSDTESLKVGGQGKESMMTDGQGKESMVADGQLSLVDHLPSHHHLSRKDWKLINNYKSKSNAKSSTLPHVYSTKKYVHWSKGNKTLKIFSPVDSTEGQKKAISSNILNLGSKTDKYKIKPFREVLVKTKNYRQDVDDCAKALCSSDKIPCSQEQILQCVQYVKQKMSEKVMTSVHNDIIHLLSLLNLTKSGLKRIEDVAKQSAEKVNNGAGDRSTDASIAMGNVIQQLYNGSFSASRKAFAAELKRLSSKQTSKAKAKSKDLIITREAKQSNKKGYDKVYKCSSACKQNGGRWSVWSSWNNCAEECQLGSIAERTRSCLMSSVSDCDGYVDTQYSACQCNVHPQSTDSSNSARQQTGHWASWSTWATCSVSCGLGMQSRHRECTLGKNKKDKSSVICGGVGATSKPCIMTSCDRTNGHWIKRVLEGRDQVLDCGFLDVMNGQIIGDVYWLTPSGQKVSESSNSTRMYVDKKSLVLRDTQREDQGVYHCVMVPSFTSGSASNAITTDTHLQVLTCFNSPCLNGGTCMEEGNYFTRTVRRAICTCPVGYVGHLCQTKSGESTFVTILVATLCGVAMIIMIVLSVFCWFCRRSKKSVGEEGTGLLKNMVKSLDISLEPDSDKNKLNTSIVHGDDSCMEITEGDYVNFQTQYSHKKLNLDSNSDTDKCTSVPSQRGFKGRSQSVPSVAPYKKPSDKMKAKSENTIKPKSSKHMNSRSDANTMKRNVSFRSEKKQRSDHFLSLHGLDNSLDMERNAKSSSDYMAPMQHEGTSDLKDMDHTYLSVNNLFGKSFPYASSHTEHAYEDIIPYDQQKENYMNNQHLYHLQDKMDDNKFNRVSIVHKSTYQPQKGAGTITNDEIYENAYQYRQTNSNNSEGRRGKNKPVSCARTQHSDHMHRKVSKKYPHAIRSLDKKRTSSLGSVITIPTNTNIVYSPRPNKAVHSARNKARTSYKDERMEYTHRATSKIDKEDKSKYCSETKMMTRNDQRKQQDHVSKYNVQKHEPIKYNIDTKNNIQSEKQKKHDIVIKNIVVNDAQEDQNVYQFSDVFKNFDQIAENMPTLSSCGSIVGDHLNDSLSDHGIGTTTRVPNKFDSDITQYEGVNHSLEQHVRVAESSHGLKERLLEDPCKLQESDKHYDKSPEMIKEEHNLEGSSINLQEPTFEGAYNHQHFDIPLHIKQQMQKHIYIPREEQDTHNDMQDILSVKPEQDMTLGHHFEEPESSTPQHHSSPHFVTFNKQLLQGDGIAVNEYHNVTRPHNSDNHTAVQDSLVANEHQHYIRPRNSGNHTAVQDGLVANEYHNVIRPHNSGNRTAVQDSLVANEHQHYIRPHNPGNSTVIQDGLVADKHQHYLSYHNSDIQTAIQDGLAANEHQHLISALCTDPHLVLGHNVNNDTFLQYNPSNNALRLDPNETPIDEEGAYVIDFSLYGPNQCKDDDDDGEDDGTLKINSIEITDNDRTIQNEAFSDCTEGTLTQSESFSDCTECRTTQSESFSDYTECKIIQSEEF